MTLIVNLIGIGLIAFIVWWFWLYKPKATKNINGQTIDIVMKDGYYKPKLISAKVGETVSLRIFRKDPSTCAEMIVFSDFDISSELVLNEPNEIILRPKVPGEFEFTCQMGMYRGKLVVEPN